MAEIVRLNVYLTPEQFEALERLRLLCGHDTIFETVEEALKLYGVEGSFDDILVVEDKDDG